MGVDDVVIDTIDNWDGSETEVSEDCTRIEYDKGKSRLTFFRPGNYNRDVVVAPATARRLFSVADNGEGFRGYWLCIGWRNMNSVDGGDGYGVKRTV